MRSHPAVVLLTLSLLWLLPQAGAGAAEDPLQDEQWGLSQVRAPQAWFRVRGAGTVVAVVDSGIDLDHPDLASRVIGGATFVGCDDPDGCGTGDWEDGETDATRDPHGTHVAGIAAAAGGNGRGVAGLAPAAALLSVKVIRGSADPPGGSASISDVAAGVRWAVRRGADVVNLSIAQLPGVGQALATTGSELRTVVEEAAAAGVIVVAAAGNEALPACDEPAFAPEVVCVVATNREELPASYSNRASDPAASIVAAPGGEPGLCSGGVLSTVGADQERTCSPVQGYGVMSGTSMAAPHVAGAAALLLAQQRSPEAVVERILTTARTPGVAARGSYSPAYGRGIVDAAAATADPPESGPAVRRAGGADRVATAVALSRAEHHRSHTVVLARSDVYADALSGGPLAASLGAPLLLTRSDGLSPATATEIDRLEADEVVLLGGTAALTSRVEHDLRSLGVGTERIGGRTRFHTAAAVAERLPPPREVFVAEGMHDDSDRGWPDALSASGLAATTGSPILLVTREALPGPTAELVDGDVDVTIVGGPRSVGEAVADALSSRARSVRRLAGSDRYATSVAVARDALARGLSPRNIAVATGSSFPDGLAAGALAGARGGVLLLVPPGDLDVAPSVRAFLADVGPAVHRLLVAGGDLAVSERVLRELAALVG